MIKRKRLKELFEQGKTIYVKKLNFILDYDLKDENINISPRIDYALRKFDSLDYCEDIPEKDLYETIEDAQFGVKYQDVTRKEVLYLPNWKDFKEEKFVKFSTPDKRILGLEAVLVVDLSKENEISEYSIVITDINDYEHNELFQSEFTEEGYLQACEKAKELFLEG